jgi:hypothetical protein
VEERTEGLVGMISLGFELGYKGINNLCKLQALACGD